MTTLATSEIGFKLMALALRICAALALPLAQAAAPSADDIFQGTNLLHMAIEIPDEGMRTLAGRRASRDGSKPKAEARVTEGGRVYTKVTVQLKGFTTFRPVDSLPSLTLDFNQLMPRQNFHGLTKLSLNNSLQDATRLHEKFARELFAAAGVPVPRADYAVVTLNGRELGLYVLTEGFDKEFLKGHFKKADGYLYEAGVLKDIDQPLHLDVGRDPTNGADVRRLIRAAREPDPEKRWRELNAALDMERFISMMAMETILCHSDSYSMNRNNYRLYHDPATDRMVFMPHGMDRILGEHRSSLDLAVVPPALGLVARAVLATPEGRRRHVERLGTLFTNVFDPERLSARVRELDARILSAKTKHPSDGRFDRAAQRHEEDADNLCTRITERVAELKFQLADLPALLIPAPAPEFDTNATARLPEWKPKRWAAKPEPGCVVRTENGVTHVHSTNGPVSASLRCRITLPVGDYHLSGLIQITNAAGALVKPALSVLRYSSDRFGPEKRTLNASRIQHSFQVRDLRAPEEIEFICDLRDPSPDVWMDASALVLGKGASPRDQLVR